MEIFTLFDGAKYFKIEFIKNITSDELSEIEQKINNAFDMQKEVRLRDIEIKKDEISIDCEHSLKYAELNIHTSNQVGLLAYVMHKLEELNINVATAKIHSSKYRVRDSFLIEKQTNLCDNVNSIYTLLVGAD